MIDGYTGPGGKSILPSRAEAKFDLRMVPNQTYDEIVGKLRAHLDRRGFSDVRLNVSGGYDPTESAEDSRLIRGATRAYRAMGVEPELFPRMAGSWPGSVFTQPPVGVPALQFGVGMGGGAHAADEFVVIESSNPKVGGYNEQVMAFVHMLYAISTD